MPKHKSQKITKGRKAPVLSRKTSTRLSKKQSPSAQKPIAAEKPEISNDLPDDEVRQNERNKFYELIKETDSFTKKALGKFPMKKKVSEIIHSLGDLGNVPACEPKWEMKRKWIVNDGKLCAKGNKKPICAYEDLYYFIADVDHENEYRLSKVNLECAVQMKSGNITKALVTLYCDRVCTARMSDNQHKRKRENKTSTEDLERKKVKMEELNNFIETAATWTAQSLLPATETDEMPLLSDRKMPANETELTLQSLETPPNLEESVKEQSVTNEHGATTTAPVVHTLDSSKKANATTVLEDSTVPDHNPNPKNSTDSVPSENASEEPTATAVIETGESGDQKFTNSKKANATTVLEDSTVPDHNPNPKNSTDSVPSENASVPSVTEEPTATAVIETGESGDQKLTNILKKMRESNPNETNGEHFHSEFGIYNDSDKNKVCWLNVVLIILFHQLPKSTIGTLSTFGLNGDETYKDRKGEFLSTAYHLINILGKNTTKDRQLYGGNAVFTASSVHLIDVFERHFNASINETYSYKNEEEKKEYYFKREQCQDINDMMHHGLLSFCDGLHPFENCFCVPEYREGYRIMGTKKEFEVTKELEPFFGLDFVQYKGWKQALGKHTETLLANMRKIKKWKGKLKNKKKHEFAIAVSNAQMDFQETLTPSKIINIIFGTKELDHGDVPGEVKDVLEAEISGKDKKQKMKKEKYQKWYHITSFPKVLVFSILQTGNGAVFFGDENIKKIETTSFLMKYKYEDIDHKVQVWNKPFESNLRATYQTCGLVYRTNDNDDLNVGHYIAVVRQPHNNVWRYFDDSHETFEIDDVTKEKWEEMKKKLLVVLVFMNRIDEPVACT